MQTLHLSYWLMVSYQHLYHCTGAPNKDVLRLNYRLQWLLTSRRQDSNSLLIMGITLGGRSDIISLYADLILHLQDASTCLTAAMEILDRHVEYSGLKLAEIGIDASLFSGGLFSKCSRLSA